MMDYEIKDGVAIIPEGTTEIGCWALINCSDLKSVVIPLLPLALQRRMRRKIA